MSQKLSVILVVYNEADKIRRCLEAVGWADEIVVVDQSSIDETAAICREYTDKVFVVSNKRYCEPDRKTAIAHTKNDWILYIDADEVVTDDLKNEIELLLSSDPPFHSYYLLRRNYLLGKWIRGSGWYPNYVMRLFKRGWVEFSDTIHVDTISKEKAGYLKNHILHYSYETLNDYVAKLDRYTTVLAKQAYVRGKRIKPLTIYYDFLLAPSYYFLQKFLLKRGFIDGLRGFLIAIFTFYTIFLTNVKVWEIEQCSRGPN